MYIHHTSGALFLLINHTSPLRRSGRGLRPPGGPTVACLAAIASKASNRKIGSSPVSRSGGASSMSLVHFDAPLVCQFDQFRNFRL